MAAVAFGELHTEVLVQLKPTIFTDQHNLAAFVIEVELVIPCRIKRIGPAEAFAVTADLYQKT